MSTIYRFIISNVFAVAFFLIFSACQKDNCDQMDQFPKLTDPIAVERLEDQLLTFEKPEDAIVFLSNNKTMADYFLDARQYPNDTILGRKLFKLAKDSSMMTLIYETKEYFSDLNKNMNELSRAYSFIQSNYPEFEAPRIQTMVSGLYNDLYVSDTLVVVGLDYFMGIQGSVHPNDVPLYIIRRYMNESLVPILISFTSNDFNKTDQSHQTLLADMINLGKSYYFVSQVLPCTPDSLIIGYTSEEMQLVLSNQEVIWANLIENELLYDTSHVMKNKFIGENPNIVEISEKCPGRVGAWLGWEIVKKYMEKNPDVTLVQLMEEQDAHKIFQLSRYKPKDVK